jgi:hypothetical protein
MLASAAGMRALSGGGLGSGGGSRQDWSLERLVQSYNEVGRGPLPASMLAS